ncbi:hypothetical protein Gocc_1669 [Gaiella occulta]|uniref:DUF1028 domain-containing protein n=1 Tax=Gaiella occulta TaxID=1002870 RepID=A0A7M2YYG3_9ACTN|nr:DUF1028 domain-containing protein [Gaiella occulta]RDI74780.1 hypothetical protein Gocc_1669 [Gaiella occulta]
MPPFVPLKATFSICAADVSTGEVGCAVQSKYFAVGAVVPWARAGVGAVATQAAGVAAFGPRVLDSLEAGRLLPDALAEALAGDAGRETRQLGAVAASGASAAHTGADCLHWAGHRVGPGYAVQGNILAGEAVVAGMESAFLATGGSLAERLVAALEAGQAAGGDVRGQQSAAVVVERAGAAAESREGVDRICDLRVDDHPRPIEELRRLLGIHLVWDALRRATAHYEARRWREGAELLRGALARHGESAPLLYDLGCFAALTGARDEALAHIARALALDPALRESARADGDLAALADDPRFRELMA